MNFLPIFYLIPPTVKRIKCMSFWLLQSFCQKKTTIAAQQLYITFLSSSLSYLPPYFSFSIHVPKKSFYLGRVFLYSEYFLSCPNLIRINRCPKQISARIFRCTSKIGPCPIFQQTILLFLNLFIYFINHV